jgi:hypothetical protein
MQACIEDNSSKLAMILQKHFTWNSSAPYTFVCTPKQLFASGYSTILDQELAKDFTHNNWLASSDIYPALVGYPKQKLPDSLRIQRTPKPVDTGETQDDPMIAVKIALYEKVNSRNAGGIWDINTLSAYENSSNVSDQCAYNFYSTYPTTSNFVRLWDHHKNCGINGLAVALQDLLTNYITQGEKTTTVYVYGSYTSTIHLAKEIGQFNTFFKDIFSITVVEDGGKMIYSVLF